MIPVSPSIQDEAVEFLQALVRTPSLSGQEESVAHLVQQKARALAFDEVVRDAWGNIIATRFGATPGPHRLFDAHMDVVPPGDASAWNDGNPYSGYIHDGRLWGRGATDTKGSLAAMLVALGRLPREAFRGTLTVVASVGEEAFEGAALAQVCSRLKPDVVIIGEPSDCRLGIGQKGRARLWVRVEGRAAHSSTPQYGENAIYKAAEVVQRLRNLPPARHPQMGEGVMEVLDIHSEPYPSASTVPYTCLLRYDRRLLPGEDRQSLLATYMAALETIPGVSMGFEEITLKTYTGHSLQAEDFHPAWLMPSDSPWLEQALRALSQAGLPAETFVAPYCTNGSASAGELGIPTFIFGPSSIALAHQVNESIEIAEFLRALAGYFALGQALGEA